jgi:NitT/TauT family transport system substrate-binding protein
MPIIQTRRRFLTGAAMAGAAGIVGLPKSLHAEPPLDTTTVRLPKWDGSGYCWAAEYIAGELLRAEGLTDVRYVQPDSSVDNSVWIARGETDFDVNFPPIQIASIDRGVPIKVLTGLHSGCLELIANESVRNITDLRGKRVGVDMFGGSSHVWLTLIVAYVGLDPVKDIRWVPEDGTPAAELFVDGKIDAFLGTPPRPQELRASKIGHTILNMTTDRPWSQYFCCMLAGNADYVKNYPVATKRALRAILKAVDLCVSDPPQAARLAADKGLASSYDYALQALAEVRFDKWRDYDPEDTMRFYSLRLREAGKIEASPQKIIADGTDWRFLDELKRELRM